MLKRSILARTAMGTAVAAMSLTTLLSVPTLAAAAVPMAVRARIERFNIKGPPERVR